MGSGKTSTQTQTVKLPKELQQAAASGLQLATDVGALPAMNNFAPQVAAANPMQQAAMNQTNQAASAFGLTPGGGLGLPDAVNTAGGYSGYSTKPLYEAGMAGLTGAQRTLLDAFQYNPQTGAAPTHPNINATNLMGTLSGEGGGAQSASGKGGSIFSPSSLAALQKTMR